MALSSSRWAFSRTHTTRSWGSHEGASLILHFTDITDYEELLKKYNDERVYMMLVNVDNFDELTASNDGNESGITASIDRLLRDWAAEMGAMIVRYKESLYELVITNKNYEKLVEEKFPILDKAREIETDADFPVTLSLGLGLGGKSLVELDDFAQEALDMALGSLQPPLLPRHLVAPELRALMEYDAQKGTQYFDTLRVY